MIKNPENWCQGALRREEIVRELKYEEMEIPEWKGTDILEMTMERKIKIKIHYQYCTIGAIYKAAGITEFNKKIRMIPTNVENLLHELLRFTQELGFRGIDEFNDHSRHWRVIMVLRQFGERQGYLQCQTP